MRTFSSSKKLVVLSAIVHAAARCRLTFCRAAHTDWEVAGIAKASVPIALVSALITAAGAAIAPASPQPLMPSGFDGLGVRVVATLKLGRLSARGMQESIIEPVTSWPSG